MQRRDFLKVTGLTGLAIPAWAWTGEALAQASPYTGRILINIHADGALDQSSWTDPRETEGAMNLYAAAGKPAGLAGRIRYAPMAANKAFFDKYYRQMLVINGVHSETNTHPVGIRVNATGQLGMGYPNISELFAFVHGAGLPMAWLNSGGYGISAGLAAATAIPDVATWRSLTTPNASSATRDLMKPADVARLQAARFERLAAMRQRTDMLPLSRSVTEQFLGVSQARGLLQRAAAPSTPDRFTQAQIALLAAQAGIVSTIELQVGYFDAHRDLDKKYAARLPYLTDSVDYVWQKAADLGIADRIFMRIYSDFGRTPYLNAGGGKDHWAVGTQILMEANPRWGNRVFGASGPHHEQLAINVATGAVDPERGKVIRPRHVHAAIRKYLGINTTDSRFDLKVPPDEAFDFFNPGAHTGYPHL